MAGIQNNPAAARAALSDLSRVFQGLIDGDAPRRIIRPGIAAGLRVLRDAIRAATPINRRRVRQVSRRFARRALKMPLHAVVSADPQVSGRLRRSVGASLKNKRGRIEGKVGLNVGKRPSKTPNAYAPHAHLVTLGTKQRRHKTGKGVGRMTPQRFVRRAAAAASGRARQVAEQEIRRQVERHLSKGTTFTRKQGRAINLLYSL